VKWLVQNLQPVVGDTITGVLVQRKEVLRDGERVFSTPLEAQEFLTEKLVGHTLVSIENRAKYVLWHFENDALLLSHLGFTGWWAAAKNERVSPRKFIHTLKPENSRFYFETNQGQLHYLDPRLLGRARFFQTRQAAEESKFLSKLAPDADTPQALYRVIDLVPTTNRRIRDLIMDQSVIAGIGNYLACEILHRARLHGATRSKTLDKGQVALLVRTIETVLIQAKAEDNRDWWQVFQKEGNACGTCGTKIIREVWGNRGNYTCPGCQVPPENWQEPGPPKTKRIIG